MKKILFIVCLLFGLSLFAKADPMYITVVDSAAAKKEDIALKLDKKDVAISDFVAVDTSNRTPEILSHPGGRRQYLLLFDLLNSKPENMVEARKITSVFLEKLGPDDLVAVAEIGKKTGLRLLSGFTSDRNKTNAGLNAIGLEKIDGVVQGPDGNLYSLQFNPQNQTVALIPEDKFLANVTAGIAADDKKKVDTASPFITAFSDLAYSLASVDGRKNIVLFSPGFDTKGAKIDVSETSFFENYESAAIRDDTYIGTTEEERAKEEQKRKEEREKPVAAPMVQVEGIPEFVSGTFTSVQMISPIGQEFDFFKKLTATNHGLYLRQVQDPAAAVDQILSADSKFLVIGFDGKTEKEFKKAHDLKIAVAGRDVPISAWVAPHAYPQFRPMERQLHVSQATYKNYLAPTAGERFWADFTFQQGQAHVPVFAQLSGTELIKKDIPELALEFYSFLIDEQGTIVDFAAIPVRMDLKNKQLRERLTEAGVKVWNQLLATQGPGPAKVRCVLIDSVFGDTTTYTSPMEIQSADLTTTYPFFPATNLQWVIWPKPSDSQSKRGVQLQYPYSMGQDQMFFPDLTPSLKKAESGQVIYFKIYNKPAGAKNPPIKLQLLDQSGKSTEIEQFALLQKPKDLEQGGMELFWKLQAIPDVPPGTYQFRVNIKDSAKNKEVVRTIPMLIQ